MMARTTDLWSPQPFDMGKTLRHPDVVRARMDSVIEQIRSHRLAIAAREDELTQLVEIMHQMLVSSREQPNALDDPTMP